RLSLLLHRCAGRPGPANLEKRDRSVWLRIRPASLAIYAPRDGGAGEGYEIHAEDRSSGERGARGLPISHGGWQSVNPSPECDILVTPANKYWQSRNSRWSSHRDALYFRRSGRSAPCSPGSEPTPCANASG